MVKANVNHFGIINPLYLFNIATGKFVSQKNGRVFIKYIKNLGIRKE